jgi:hypothetical protein
VGRRPFVIAVFTPQRSEGNEVGELTRGQPREPAALVQATKSEAPVAIEAVPAQRSGVEELAAH